MYFIWRILFFILETCLKMLFLFIPCDSVNPCWVSLLYIISCVIIPILFHVNEKSNMIPSLKFVSERLECRIPQRLRCELNAPFIRSYIILFLFKIIRFVVKPLICLYFTFSLVLFQSNCTFCINFSDYRFF